jgi:hypothetical protein
LELVFEDSDQMPAMGCVNLTVILGNLVASGEVRVEIMFSVKCRTGLNIRFESQCGSQSQIHAFEVETLDFLKSTYALSITPKEDFTGNVPGKAASYGDTCVFGTWPSSDVKDSVGPVSRDILHFPRAKLASDLKIASSVSLVEREPLYPQQPPILAIWGLLCKCAEREIGEFDGNCGVAATTFQLGAWKTNRVSRSSLRW